MRHSAARHDHSTQHITDVKVRRVYAGAGDGTVTLAWDYPGSTLLEVRILRSQGSFAASADDGAGQVVVYDDVSGSFRDAGLRNGAGYSYTVFAREPGGNWERWGEHRLVPRRETVGGWRGLPRRVRQLFGRRATYGVLVAALVLATVSAALPHAAAAASAPAASADAAAVAAATADAQVRAALRGVSYQTSVRTWGGTAGAPAGATITFKWPAAAARDVTATWPLVKSEDNGTPVPPYTTVSHRLRILDLSALQVDVLFAGREVIQIMPLDGATTFTLREETWPPFSSMPWFTARPWVLLPAFVLIGVVVITRAWLRSRAWNRRLPSMTRHDRQFIGRFIVIVFLAAGLAWQIYEAVYAVSAPAVDPRSVSAGQLAALPLLLYPPAIFLAALVLELSPAPHRFAWGLVAVLAGAGGFYSLAIAVTSTANNLNLSYYILLGILCLLAAPRAFSAGRMGWSRNNLPRYA